VGGAWLTNLVKILPDSRHARWGDDYIGVQIGEYWKQPLIVRIKRCNSPEGEVEDFELTVLPEEVPVCIPAVAARIVEGRYLPPPPIKLCKEHSPWSSSYVWSARADALHTSVYR
jgi:hypothetical protein